MLDVESLSKEVWRLTFRSPEDRNALSAAMRQAVLDALATAKRDGARVAIIRGSDGVFSSGYRLDPGVMRPATVMEDRARLAEVADFHRRFRDQSVITLAQISGHCIAGGTDLMVASDLAFAAHDASIAVPNVRGVGITLLFPLWSWLVGPQRAKLLALTGDPIRGEEAAAMGLVAGSLPGDVLEERVLAIANRIALMPSEMLDVVKQSLNLAWDTAGMAAVLTRAAELDALSHATVPVIDFWETVEVEGIKTALRERDGAFDGGRLLDIVAQDGVAGEVVAD